VIFEKKQHIINKKAEQVLVMQKPLAESFRGEQLGGKA
jgi:hypothetical protein